MYQKIFSILVLFNLLTLAPAFAESEQEILPVAGASAERQTRQVSIPDYMSLFTVKVNNRTASIFTPVLSGGLGTGFVVNRVKNKEGKDVLHIFTNRHVIESAPESMQNLSVDFHSSPNAPSIPAKLVYKSDLHDFAILEVPLEEVVKNQISVMPAPMPLSAHDPKDPQNAQLNMLEKALRESPLYFPGLKGMKTYAVGNPLGAENVLTEGSINTFRMDGASGPYLQTQTPINPGNSGGPLIAQVAPGVFIVVGINTMIFVGAQNVGLSIPIGVLMQEYGNWLHGATVSRPKDYVLFNMLGPDLIKNYGYDVLLKAAVPNYDGGPVLSVAQNTRNSPLLSNDLLLTMNGQRVHSLYQYKRMLLFTDYKQQKSIPLEVLRNGQLMKIDLPLAPLEYAQARNELDFVYLSGFVFQQFSGKQSAIIRPDIKSRVYVSNIVKTPEMEFAKEMNVIPKMSILQSIDIDGKNYPIGNLLDLKMALKNATPKSIVLTHYYRPLNAAASSEEDDESPKKSAPLYTDMLSHTRVAKPEVYTPANLSLRQIKENADLNINGDVDSRNWRTYVNKPRPAKAKVSTCDEALR